MSYIGKKICDFELQMYVDGEFKRLRRKDREGKWSVLFFYPADFTFVCPTELEDLQEKYREFSDMKCEVYGISCDSHFVHKAWHDTSERIRKLQYPLVADPTGTLVRDLDIMIEKDGMAERGTFILNPDCEIMAYEVIAGNVGRNADEIVRRVQALQFVDKHGEDVCPAKWKPGEETLKPGIDLVGIL